MPTNPTFLEKTLAQFRERFPGELNAITDNGGFDAKPYLEDFLTKTIQDLATELEKQVNELPVSYVDGSHDANLIKRADVLKILSKIVG